MPATFYIYHTSKQSIASTQACISPSKVSRAYSSGSSIADALSEFCEQGVILNPFSALLQSIRNNSLITTLFSDSRSAILVNRLESGLKSKIYDTYPEYKNNLEWDVLITILIQGSFHAFSSHIKYSNTDTLVNIIGDINNSLISSYTKQR